MAARSDRDRCWRRYQREVKLAHTKWLLLTLKECNVIYWIPSRSRLYRKTYTRRLSPQVIVLVPVETVEDFDIYVEHKARKRRDTFKQNRHETSCNPRRADDRPARRLTVQERRFSEGARQELRLIDIDGTAALHRLIANIEVR